MSLVRMALGLAAATAAAVMYSNARRKSGGSSYGTDSGVASPGMGSAGQAMSGGGIHDDLLSPATTADDDLGNGSSQSSGGLSGTGRSGVL